MSSTQHNDERFMRLALEQASLAERLGEVPVGAVVVHDGNVIGRGHNRNLLDHDPTAHAEQVALREAGNNLGNHRLMGCDLFVTIEPCSMCAGALIHARLRRIVYGTTDPKAGAVHSVMQVINHPKLNHKMEVVPGVLAAQCAAQMQEFFRRKREGKT